MSKPAPYPADTRAKGWRFELDLERIRQSDTWALASPEARPWLLLLWATAWEQTPCGSLPVDDALIAARIGMAAKAFDKHKAVLLRGWERADDGRMYHATITQRVLEMLARRRKEADRKALARAGKGPDGDGSPPEVPPLSRGTNAGLHPESDTGTGTGTSEDTGAKAPAGRARKSAGAVSTGEAVTTLANAAPLVEARKAMVAAGMQPTAINGSSPLLAELVAAGATPEEFAAAARKAQGKANPFAYALKVVASERSDAAATAKGLHRGPLPAAAEQPWRAEERARNTAFAGAAAATPLRAATFIDAEEPDHAVPRLVG